MIALADRKIRNRLNVNLIRNTNLIKESSMKLSTSAKYAIIIIKAIIVWGGSKGSTGINIKGNPINPTRAEAILITSAAMVAFFQLISKNL